MAKSDPVRLRPRRPCPICGKPSLQKYHPFCSARCSQIDLGRWLGGKYAIGGDEEDKEEKPGSPAKEDE
jgi:endogenous inhibitor of DNA gyrase (YacG/DUF329 family)